MTISEQEIIKLKLKELAYETWGQVLSYQKELHLRKISNFYIDLKSCFKPIGFGYPDGDEELEYEYTYFQLEGKVLESTIYSELYSILKSEYQEKFKDKDESSSLDNLKVDSLKLFISTYVRLLIRNLLHHNHHHNLFQDYLGYKDSQIGDNKTYDKFREEYEKIPSETRGEESVAFIHKIIETFIAVFINDLNDISPVYINKIFISGIKLEQNEYKISDTIVLRKIKSSDETPSKKNPFTRFLFANRPTCILEFESESADISSPYGLLGNKNNLKQILLNSLKLFTLNGFKVIQEMVYPISIDKQFFSENKTHSDNLKRNPFLFFEPNTELKEEDARNFAKSIELIKYINEANNPDNEFISVALDFFLEALSKNTLSGTLTYSIHSLEALYNTSNKNVTENLRRKCSLLLSIFREINCKKYDKFSKKAIYKNLGKGYDVRSEYVHGENPSKFSDLGLTEKIKEYTYYSLLIFMQLMKISDIEEIRNDFKQEYRTKKRILNDFIIQNALINNKYADKLKEILNKCDLYEPYYNYKTIKS